VLVTPTLACRVPPTGTDPIEVDGVEEAVTPALTRLTNPWNLAGVPAGSVPAGTDGGGAPVGIQVVGPWFADRRVLSLMAEVERLSGGPWRAAAPPVAG
jgi:aspartyl-tRNA(Asn)/glutamyl-tRNA(Gln) amidotransferase subunit A